MYYGNLMYRNTMLQIKPGNTFQKMVAQINDRAKAAATYDNTQLSYSLKVLDKEKKANQEEKTKQAPAVAVPEKTAEDFANMANIAVTEKRNWLMGLGNSLYELSEQIQYTEAKKAEAEGILADSESPEWKKMFAQDNLEETQEQLDRLYQDVPHALERVFLMKKDKLYEALYGEKVTKPIQEMIGNTLDGFNEEGLGLTDLGTDTEKVVAALEKASQTARELAGKLEESYRAYNQKEMKTFDVAPRSREELWKHFEEHSVRLVQEIRVDSRYGVFDLDSDDFKELQEALQKGCLKEAGNLIDTKA